MSELVKSSEWHALRASNIGSSEVAALFGCQAPYQMSHYTLWHVKAGLVPAPPVEGERVRWGVMLEDAIAHGIAHENGWVIRKGEFCLDWHCPKMSCTPDYEIVGGSQPEGFPAGPGLLETKNIDYAQWKREWTESEPPPYVILQLQHQLACKGYAWGCIGGFIGGNTLRNYPYLASASLAKEIRARIANFWQSIQEGKPPPVDGSDGALHVLRSLYPVAEGSADLRNDNEWPEIAAQFLETSEAVKKAEKARELAKNRLVAKIGGYKSAWGSGYSVSVSVTPEKPPRVAEPGEVIPGRKESRTYRVKIMENAQ